ncbi:MAG: PIG-L family deacetylase, partial [Chloroflexi bacterium]|nr:PIG-L family deacetylase [Chloroflexota bacterium]
LEAAKILGLKDVAFLNYPDAFLTPSLELRHDIAREIRRYRPDIVVCPSPTRNLDNNFYVGHPDHLAAGEATISAVYPTARDRLTYPDLLKEGLEPHKVRELWITMGAGANYWVELAEDDLKTAIRALMAHSSQVGDGAERRVREWRARTGSLRGMRYAESFKVFKMRG